jgi:hypothetical protein
MKFEFKETKVTRHMRHRMPDGVTNVRAYKVRLKPGPGYDGGVIGTVIGSDMGSKPGWATWRDGMYSGGSPTRQAAAEKLV